MGGTFARDLRRYDDDPHPYVVPLREESARSQAARSPIPEGPPPPDRSREYPKSWDRCTALCKTDEERQAHAKAAIKAAVARGYDRDALAGFVETAGIGRNREGRIVTRDQAAVPRTYVRQGKRRRPHGLRRVSLPGPQFGDYTDVRGSPFDLASDAVAAPLTDEQLVEWGSFNRRAQMLLYRLDSKSKKMVGRRRQFRGMEDDDQTQAAETQTA